MTTFRMFEYSKIEVNRLSTKQFQGDFLEMLKQFSGRGPKINCF